MKLIETDYKIISRKGNITTIDMVVPYYMIAEIEFMGTIKNSWMLPVTDIVEGIKFIIPSNYREKASYIDNIISGADIILQALSNAEKNYFSVLYNNGTITRDDAIFILPLCTAYRVIMECNSGIVYQVVNSIRL